MSAVTTALNLVIHASLGIWLGTILFFSFVAAPKTFGVLERERAGDVVNAIFPTYYLVGIVAGVIAFGAGVALGVVTSFDLFLGIMFLGTFVGVVLNIYARQILIPKIRATEGDAFEKYHGLSVKLNGIALVGVAVALIASHL